MTDYCKFSERELVDKSAEGDQRAFEQLLSENKERVEGWILSFTRKPQLVEDIFQMTSFKAWKYIGRFRKECKFSTWVCNIARNCFYDYYRARQSRPETSLEDMIERYGKVDNAMPHYMLPSYLHQVMLHPRNEEEDSKYYISQIEERLESLDDAHREPLMLFLRDGLGYSEIAKKLKCPVGTVMSRIFYGRKKAQRVLKDLRDELIVQ